MEAENSDFALGDLGMASQLISLLNSRHRDYSVCAPFTSVVCTP